VDVVAPQGAAFGRRAQQEVVTQEEALAPASRHGLLLVCLGGDNGGVIGALAAVGLAGDGSDGRYVLVGRSRDLCGLQPVEAILGTGIEAIQTSAGEPVTGGLVQSDKLCPARRQGRRVLVVDGPARAGCRSSLTRTIGRTCQIPRARLRAMAHPLRSHRQLANHRRACPVPYATRVSRPVPSRS
jgi:hypothetical protein